MKKHSWVHWFLAVILSELLPKIYMFSWNTCIDLVSVVKCNSTACFKFIICNLNTDLMKDKYYNFIISKETLLGISTSLIAVCTLQHCWMNSPYYEWVLKKRKRGNSNCCWFKDCIFHVYHIHIKICMVFHWSTLTPFTMTLNQ